MRFLFQYVLNAAILEQESGTILGMNDEKYGNEQNLWMIRI